MNMALPNILLLLTDDQRFDTIAALGNPNINTPHFDKLVARGTSFTQAHIPGGTCGAVCMPSRAMLHTGRTLFHLQGSGQKIPVEHTLMGEWLGRAGYTTFGTGKWHNGKSAFNRSFQEGQEIFFGGMQDHWNVPAYHYDSSGAYENTIPVCKDPFGGKKVEHLECDHIKPGVHSTDLFAEATKSFIRLQSDENPFFAFVSFMAPHDPRIMPDRFRDLYKDERIELPANFCGGHPWDTGAIHIRDEMLAGFPRSEQEVREHIADYYAMITHLDTNIGEVIDTLEETGHLDNTIIVLTGDNGLAIGQHGLMGKQNLYDHSVRVPLVMAGPGIPRASQNDSLVYLLDLFPTFCEMTGQPIPESVEGRSLLPCLQNASHSHRESLYLAYERYQRGVRRGDFKLIEYQVNGDRHTQLFNVVQDRWELNNLAGCSDHATELASLRAEMIRLRDEWGDCDTEWGGIFWSGYTRKND